MISNIIFTQKQCDTSLADNAWQATAIERCISWPAVKRPLADIIESLPVIHMDVQEGANSWKTRNYQRNPPQFSKILRWSAIFNGWWTSTKSFSAQLICKCMCMQYLIRIPIKTSPQPAISLNNLWQLVMRFEYAALAWTVIDIEENKRKTECH